MNASDSFLRSDLTPSIYLFIFYLFLQPSARYLEDRWVRWIRFAFSCPTAAEFQHEILGRGRRVLRAPNPSYRPRAQQLQLLRSLPASPTSFTHTAFCIVPESTGFPVSAGHICLPDPFLVRRRHRCHLRGPGPLELRPPGMSRSAQDTQAHMDFHTFGFR